IGHNSFCGLCGHQFEDVLHVIRDCPAAKETWLQSLICTIFLNQLLARWFGRVCLGCLPSEYGELEPFPLSGGSLECRRDLPSQQEPRVTTLMPDKWIQLCIDGAIQGIIDKLHLIQNRKYVEVMIQVDSLE
ncbi:hypothetical protein Gogos_020180, partial [Gossypium gossypioides]|nr:hypothetical protein [Gossypium gossypioides]